MAKLTTLNEGMYKFINDLYINKTKWIDLYESLTLLKNTDTFVLPDQRDHRRRYYKVCKVLEKLVDS